MKDVPDWHRTICLLWMGLTAMFSTVVPASFWVAKRLVIWIVTLFEWIKEIYWQKMPSCQMVLVFPQWSLIKYTERHLCLYWRSKPRLTDGTHGFLSDNTESTCVYICGLRVTGKWHLCFHRDDIVKHFCSWRWSMADWRVALALSRRLCLRSSNALALFRALDEFVLGQAAVANLYASGAPEYSTEAPQRRAYNGPSILTDTLYCISTGRYFYFLVRGIFLAIWNTKLQAKQYLPNRITEIVCE